MMAGYFFVLPLACFTLCGDVLDLLECFCWYSVFLYAVPAQPLAYTATSVWMTSCQKLQLLFLMHATKAR